MFLDVLHRRNPKLLEAATRLHQSGDIPGNTYVLDLDAITENARLINAEGARVGLRVLAMTKQIGRNPVAMRALREGGVSEGVAVDMQCARALARGGLRVAHLGHLVQPQQGETVEAVGLAPAFWTVFSADKARSVAKATQEQGGSQALLARIYSPGDRFYSGHEGGFPADQILSVADALNSSPGANFAGITSFPALIFDQEQKCVRTTSNLETLAAAAEKLTNRGIRAEINAPGTTSTSALRLLADAGVTQVEPGHGLTGTTPWHAVADLPEKPAMAYVTEVSHRYSGRSFCYGGGMYVDPVVAPYQVRALVGSDPEALMSTVVDAELPDPSAIDYYGQLDGEYATGATVIFGFRPQVFVTRAVVAPISGIASENPSVEGLWHSDGRSWDGR